MATAVAPPSQLPSRTTTPPPSPFLTLNTSLTSSAAVPHKYLPYCYPGPPPSINAFLSPPTSPPSADGKTSLLHSTDKYHLVNESPPIYGLSAQDLATALDHVATAPLPDARNVFPWLHGLNAENQYQLAYFKATRRLSRRVPSCLRAITIVKVGGNLTTSRIVSAISADEIIESPNQFRGEVRTFRDLDPRDTFSVRNFQIQTCKMATVSDIVVYGDDQTPRERVKEMAKTISIAQRYWQDRSLASDPQSNRYSTFVLTESFAEVESRYPHLVTIGSDGRMTGNVLDLAAQERLEMLDLSEASEIAPNVWLGPTPDPAATDDAANQFDVLIEAIDCASIPDADVLEGVERFVKDGESRGGPARLEFPGSGNITPTTCRASEVELFMGFLHWVHEMTSEVTHDEDKDVVLSDGARHRPKILFHCTDGYTDTSLFALAYLMFSEGITASQAWIKLHCHLNRNFFAYTTDKMLLEKLEKRLLHESPALRDQNPARVTSPCWMDQMDGSLPSRVLPYLYLGNLTHAMNPGLLMELGIRRVLSVGERIMWSAAEKSQWGEENLMFIDNVQDNGVDPLTVEFDRALDFIEQGRKDGATLVHCRVGVSRSATICIAKVMNELKMSFPRAYCFVRARRLNVIVQPHLRFCYELLKWEEVQAERHGIPLRRELEWATISREIALINKPYCKS